MKTIYSVSRIIFLSLVLLLIPHTSLNAQSVIVQIRALLDTKAIAPDSILFVNQRNNTTLKIGSLPSDCFTYAVNLNNGSVQSPSGLSALTVNVTSGTSALSGLNDKKSDIQIVPEGKWNYTPGDRILISIRKGNQKSQTWSGKPENGSLIQLALPKNNRVFDMRQTISSGAQINTIAFSGVAFYSGCFYASTFYPPGKVADYFGFQYLRDNDPDESGHNTDFLTKAAWHMMHILNEHQLQMLINLAVEQEELFNKYALGRLPLIKAFHHYQDGQLPTGKTMLDKEAVKKLSRDLYLIDGEISYGRAQVFGKIIQSLSETQRDSLNRLSVVGMRSWTMPVRPEVRIPRGLNVWVMSNASELFSWYLRDVEADVYFCPERQGTYFGGFYMKDAPAVGNAGYAIDMQATANKGAYLLQNILNRSQSDDIRAIYTEVKPVLQQMVLVREQISTELRKAIDGKTVDKSKIMQWSAEYGELDGAYIYSMVEHFVRVGKTLTSTQKDELQKLRNLEAYPCREGKVFLYSAPIDEPVVPDTDFLFQ